MRRIRRTAPCQTPVPAVTDRDAAQLRTIPVSGAGALRNVNTPIRYFRRLELNPNPTKTASSTVTRQTQPSWALPFS
jgi:hypothetical protein